MYPSSETHSRAQNPPVSSPDFAYTVNEGDESQWPATLGLFRDASIFQTAPFCITKSPRCRIERIVVRQAGVPCAAAMVRITRVPGFGISNAYVRWGPLWERRDATANPSVWLAALSSLHHEYVTRRRMWLRILPGLMTGGLRPPLDALESAGFAHTPGSQRQRTMIMDLRAPLESIRRCFDQKWRNRLNNAERQNLSLVSGSDDALFEKFLVPYRQMMARKGLSDAGDPEGFRSMQRLLPDGQLAHVLIALRGDDVASSIVVSGVGDTGIYHLGATGEMGTRTNASYLLHWEAIKWLKSRGCTHYDLHGVNRETNRGVYEFKAGLMGKNGLEVEFPGSFDAFGSRRARFAAGAATFLQDQLKRFRHLAHRMRHRRSQSASSQEVRAPLPNRPES